MKTVSVVKILNVSIPGHGNTRAADTKFLSTPDVRPWFYAAGPACVATQDRDCGNPKGGDDGGRKKRGQPRPVLKPCGSGFHWYEVEG